jgi:predicted alpha/beta superfamily hydrolase
MRLIYFLLALAILLSGEPAVAQPAPDVTQVPVLRGGYFQIASRQTGRSYHIHVRLPEGYDTNRAARYPVVYVLDGDSLFPIIAATHLFLTIDDKLPEAVIVGIAYGGFDPAVNKRGIDFMPPGPNIAGGAPMFHRFLKSELFPAIEGRYRVDPARRILYGQSRGGSFAIYAALTEPDLFWGSIASNPALAPTREFFHGAAAAAKRTDLTLIVANGTDDMPALRAETQFWLAERKKRADDPWALKDITIQNGTHSANNVDAYRAAMRVLFGWKAN